MREVFPDYYLEFKCIADRCGHSCCIGWEIDIDENSAEYYASLGGGLGAKLRKNISFDGEPHFVLEDGERCPFLNEKNLCELILLLGEDGLCHICAEHPRFRNYYSDTVEIGLGMCCEEAARLILGRKEKQRLLATSESNEKPAFISLRDDIISLLQDRSKSINTRIGNMLELCNARPPHNSLADWAELYLSLERLDSAWTRVLEQLRYQSANADFKGFDEYMAMRQTEYEQLLVYFVYRHLAAAKTGEDFAARAAFAALSYALLYAAGAIIWTEKGSFDFSEQVELARLYSSEIEYSDENLDIVFSRLSGKQARFSENFLI